MRTKKPPASEIPMDVLERVARTLRVLGHPHRLKIAELLLARDLTVGQLADALGIPPNACSQHLNLMRAHGLLVAQRNGKEVFYKVGNPSVINTITCIRKHELNR